MLVAIYSADNNTQDDASLLDTLPWKAFSSRCFDVQVHLPAPKQRIPFSSNKDIKLEKLPPTEEDMSESRQVCRLPLAGMVLNPPRRAAAPGILLRGRRAAIRVLGLGGGSPPAAGPIPRVAQQVVMRLLSGWLGRNHCKPRKIPCH